MPSNEFYFRDLALQLVPVNEQPAGFLIASDSSGVFRIEQKSKGLKALIEKIVRWIKTLAGTSYNFQQHVDLLHAKIDQLLFDVNVIDRLPLRKREQLANELLAARQVEITMMRVYTYAASRRPAYSATILAKDQACLEQAARLRGMTVEDLETRLTKTVCYKSQSAPSIFDLLPAEIIQKYILTLLSRHDQYYFGLSCRLARDNTFGDTEYWTNLTRHLRIPPKDTLTAQERVHDYYKRVMATFLPRLPPDGVYVQIWDNMIYELRSVDRTANIGNQYDTFMTIIHTAPSKFLRERVVIDAIESKKSDISSNIIKHALDHEWELDEKLKRLALLALSRASAPVLMEAFLQKHEPIPPFKKWRAILEALELNDLAAVQKIMQSTGSITILGITVCVTDRKYIEKLKRTLLPKVVKLDDKAIEHFLKHDPNIANCLPHLPAKVREQRPSVRLIHIAKIRFTIVNYTNLEIDCTLKGDHEMGPFSFTFNGKCSSAGSFTPDNCQIIFYPGRKGNPYYGEAEIVYSVCRDEGENKEVQFKMWEVPIIDEEPHAYESDTPSE